MALVDLIPHFRHDDAVATSGASVDPKHGVFSTINTDLYEASLEHRYRVFTDGGAPFYPTNSQLQVFGDSIVVDAYAKSDGQALQDDIVRLGGQVTGAVGALVSALVPLDEMNAFAQLSSLAWAEPAYRPAIHSGAVNSQGDLALAANAARANLGVDGSGIKIGLISDSFNRLGGYPGDLANGEFPTPVTTIVELPPVPNVTPVDEGRAMAQIVADLAPGAHQYFNTGVLGLAQWVSAVNNLRNQGVNIIVDDLIYLTEPMFQDSVLAQAVTSAAQNGVAFFSAAGNHANKGAEFGAFVDSGDTGVNGGALHDFDPGPGVDPHQRFTLPVGASIRLSFQWDQPAFVNAAGVPSPGSASDVDILVIDKTGTFAIAGGVASNINRTAVEIFQFVNDGSYDLDADGVPDTEFNIAFELFEGEAPTRMKYVDFDNNIQIEEYSTSAPTSFGHVAADGVFAVGAAPYSATPAFGVDPAVLNNYSSLGRQEILFDPAGNRLPEPIIRHHPDGTGPDQVDTTFFIPGQDLEPNGHPNFSGTSAAAPHIAAVAALMLDAAGGPGSLSVGSIYTGLKYTAHDIVERVVGAPEAIPGGLGYDYYSGHGLIDALAAVTGAASAFDLAIDANDVPGDAGVNDGDPAGDGLADQYLVTLAGNEVVVTVNGIEAARMDRDAIDTLSITGSTDDDTLTIDLSGGMPIPSGGLVFQGGGHVTAGDQVHIVGGSLSNVEHAFSATQDGASDLDGAVLSFFGVELLSDASGASTRSVHLDGDDDIVALSDGGAAADGMSRLTAFGAGPIFDFAAATSAVMIFTGTGADEVTIEALDANFATRLEIHTESGDDNVFLSPSTAAQLHIDGGPEASEDVLNVNALDAGVTDTGSELQFSGFQPVSYTDFERLAISNAGGGGGLPDITIADVARFEGTGGTTFFEFAVSLSVANPTQSVFVDYATNAGTAEDFVVGGDFVAASGTLEFPPNTTQQTIVVEVIGDATIEANERFTVDLDNAVNANLLDEQAVGTIQNDDFSPVPIAYVDDDWAGVPLGEDPDGAGPAISLGADAFADFPDAMEAVDAGGTVLMFAGEYAGATVNKDVAIEAADVGVVIRGATPALNVLAGYVSVTGVTLTTSANVVSVIVAGGALTLRGTTVLETGSGQQTALRRTGGMVDLGTLAEAGGNTLEVTINGLLIDNQASGPISALGNSWRRNGAELENFQIEDRIQHAVDDLDLGLVTWVHNALFVTALASGFDAEHNNYRRLANMAALLDDDFSVQLSGTFDFRQSHALADWAKGNDGVAGNDDDYGVFMPENVHQVTLTASSLGAASLIGPGDLAAVDLEGAFKFRGGNNRGWTISNLTILDFDVAIEMSRGSGNASAYDGLRIVDNHIRIATDLNFATAPADEFQNIGIALGPGASQQVSRNVIDIPGDGVSSGAKFSATVGIQNEPSEPADYDGLLIEDNVITVLEGQSGAPETILGIWDAGNAFASDIVIRGNQFLNASTGNDPRDNLQRAFRVGSQSGTGTTVAYENNIVDGANIGFQWQTETDLSGHEPALLLNNNLSDVFRGVVITSLGSARLSGNTLTGLGPAYGNGIDVQLGATAFVDGSLADNVISGFSRGVFVKGTAEINDNAATISGNSFGIDVDGGAAAITGNRIVGNDVGIRIADGGTVEVIAYNFIEGNDSDGVRITATAGFVGPIYSNSLSDNGGRSIRNSSGGLVDASGNWWGANDTDEVNHEAQGDIDFSPWLDTGTDIDGNPNNGFQGDFSFLHVDEDSPQAAPLGRIQEGINWATPGGEVLIHDGLYNESNTTVDRPLTITGEELRAGVIVAPAAADSNDDSAFGGTAQIGFIVQADDVTIRHITIDGDANPGLPLNKFDFRAGVLTDSRTGVVYHRTILDDIEVLHAYWRGIQFFSSDGPGAGKSEGNAIRNCLVENVWLHEAVLAAAADVEILDNKVSLAQTGIAVLARGAVPAPLATIQGNAVTRVEVGIHLRGAAGGSAIGGDAPGEGNDIDLSGFASADVGILVVRPVGQVVIAGNSIDAVGDDAGIRLFGAADPALPAIVRGNTLASGNGAGNGPGTGVGILLTDDGSLFDETDRATYAVISSNRIVGFAAGVELRRTGVDVAGGSSVEAVIGGRAGDANNTLSDNTVGVLVHDADQAAHGHLAKAWIVGNSATITGGKFGIDVDGGAASIVGNAITNNSVGIRVADEGVALIQGNDLRGNDDIGLLIETGGIVDAGQEGIGHDYTGFGVSAGGNDFSSFLLPASPSSGAIVNLNNDGGDAGRQGAPPDVSARNNQFFSALPLTIELVVYHDADNVNLGYVDFFGLQNLVLTYNSNSVDENSPVMLTGTFEDGPLPHRVVIDWADGQTDAIVLGAGVHGFNIAHAFADDDPSGTPLDVYQVLVRVEEIGGVQSVAEYAPITVSNIAPNLSDVQVTSSIDETSLATLTGKLSDASPLDTFRLIVDWGDGAIEEHDFAAGTTEFTLTHRYLDDDPSGTSSDAYSIQVTLRDDDASEDTASLTTTVHNVAPVLGGVAVTPNIDEHGVVHLTGTVADVGTLDSLTLNIDWGDGIVESFGYVPGAAFDLEHQYRDDNPTGTNGDVYNIHVTLADDDLGEDVETVSVNVANIAPALVDVAVTSTDENGVVHLTGTIVDPGTQDTFSLVVNWGEGAAEAFLLPAGTTSFDVTHQYLDDDPTGTPADNYHVTVFVRDDDGAASAAEALASTVTNVAPLLADVAATAVFENGVVHLTGAIIDPGTRDTFTLTVNWGEGAPEMFTFPAGTTSFDVAHQYLDDDPTGTSADEYLITLDLADDDGGAAQAIAAATITNVVPELLSLSVTSVDENGVAVLSGTFADAGTLDTHVLRVYWGEGVPETYLLAAGVTSFSVSHQYLDDTTTFTSQDDFTLSVALEDDDDGLVSALPTLTVFNVAPHVVGAAITPVNENGIASLTGTIVDPGTLDILQLNVHWGDGQQGVFFFAAGTTAFQITHQYRDDNPSGTSSDVYEVTVQAFDDDLGASDIVTLGATVTNVAPVATIQGAPATANTGVPINLHGVFTDVGTQDTHTLSWSVLRDGSPFATGSGANFSFTPTLAGSYQVTFTVVDDDLGSDSDVATIVVNPAGPAAPRVTSVLVGSSAWTAPFLAQLGGAAYAIPSGAGQWSTLPWVNLNQIQIAFSEAVVVTSGDLTIGGTEVASYAIGAFDYDDATFTATWTLSGPISRDTIEIALSDSIVDVNDGFALDGEWTNGTNAYPSGNGAPGGAFEFGFRVLPGDLDQSTEVGLTDLNTVRNNFGIATPNVLWDVDGDGQIGLPELNAVRNFFGTQATPIPPSPVRAAPTVFIAESEENAAVDLLMLKRDEERDDWLERVATGQRNELDDAAAWDAAWQDFAGIDE